MLTLKGNTWYKSIKIWVGFVYKVYICIQNTNEKNLGDK